jgi:hypothetical protein
MSRASICLIAFLSLASFARAESLPSFGLEFASKYASHVVVVENGKVVESWLGDLKPGTQVFPANAKSLARKVDYQASLLSAAEEEKELARLGLRKVAQVTGKRMVHFLSRERLDVWESQHLQRDEAYNRVWIEDGQVFAIVQWHNPGPSGLLPLYLKEAELKAAVLEINQAYRDIEPLLKQEDRTERTKALVALLKPDARRRNDEVHDALRLCGPEAWPVIEPLIFDAKLLPLHHGLIRTGYEVGRLKTKDAMLRVQSEERAFREKLKADGIKWNPDRLPHRYHHYRENAAQWVLDTLNAR